MAAGSLALEIFSPVTARDAKAAGNALGFGKKADDLKKVKKQRKSTKEAGQNFEEIEAAQRKKGRDKIQSIQKSKKNDRIELQEEAQRIIEEKRKNQ